MVASKKDQGGGTAAADSRQARQSSDVRLECRQLATDTLGPIRREEGLRAALTRFDKIENEKLPMMRLGPEAKTSEKALGRELESALSVRNLALLGKLVATAALHR